MSKPNKNDVYACTKCGMELVITNPCHCESGDPLLACCGESMQKQTA